MNQTSTFDLAVIGGGVNGAGVARDAAGRGASVLLLERGDLASGTSSASTKLVHGGLRYLEHGEFALVREALGERETLWRIAPHIVRPMRFVLPVSHNMRPHWMLRAALKLYDTIGGSRSFPAAQAIDLDEHRAGMPLFGNIARAFEYSDAWVDDARLVALNAVDAARHGAEIRTRCPVTSLTREGDVWRIEAGGEQFTARAVVNAAGPGVEDVAQLAGTTPAYGIRRVRGSHIVVPRLFDHNYAYLLQQPDRRICFAIPFEQDFTLIGTTDTDHIGPLDRVDANSEEIRYLCDAANRYFRHQTVPDDVVWTYAGVRALVNDGSGRPEEATRGYRLALSEEGEGAPMLGIYGGKITSYRHVAQDAVDLLAQRLPELANKAWTANAALPGGDFAKDAMPLLMNELRLEYPFLGEDVLTRIARAYGLDAIYWLDEAKEWSDLGRDFGGGLTQAEVDYLRDNEFAQSAEDVLWRRTKLGLHMDEAEQAAVAEYMGG